MLNIRIAAAVSIFCCVEHNHVQSVTGILCASVPERHFLIASEELFRMFPVADSLPAFNEN